MVDPPVAASIEGVVERVIFRSEDAAFGVLLVRKEEGSPAVKVAGPVGDAAEGALWRFTGAIEDHPKYGERLVAALAHPVVPETREGIRRYLSALGVKGLGAKSVDRLLDAFGDATLDALSKDEPPKVKGVASKVVLELREIVRRDRARADALSFLASAGLGPQISRRVFERFGASAVAIARANPFVFADEIRGVGFATADAAARKLGFPPEHPSRLRAGVLHALRSAAEQGHAGLPETRLIAAGTRLLGLDDATVSGAVSTAETLGDVVADDAGGDETLIYAPPLHAAECEAARLSRALSERRPILDPSIDVPTLPTGLSEEQREAVALLLRKPFALLTGGPGVGKTTVLRAWADSVAALGANPVLAAPTGRASRRMEEATGRPASTLHRLLRIPPSDVLSKEPPEPIDCDALAIDEASMLDLVLFVQVLRALPPHATLVLVGDPHQLPSVGPGDVLNALLRSGVAPAARLTRVFRQERGGVLVANAHRVLSGLLPEPAPIGADSDFYFMERDDAEEGALLVRDLVVERLPRRYGFDPREDVQTLSPMHRGAAGVERLNALLQEALNAGGPAVVRGDKTLRRGDRVIALRNDYVRMLANGEIGRVVAASKEASSVDVAFGPVVHVFKGPELDDLAPAFALTVHKSQGSEYPAVVLALFPEHFPMLRRSVVYTAMTRARKLLVVVGSKRALATAVEEARRARRFGLLARRLGAGDAAPEDEAF